MKIELNNNIEMNVDSDHGDEANVTLSDGDSVCVRFDDNVISVEQGVVSFWSDYGRVKMAQYKYEDLAALAEITG